jgi:hypothetical protein
MLYLYQVESHICQNYILILPGTLGSRFEADYTNVVED